MPVDARSARTARTRTRIAEALIASALEGETSPGIPDIARRAGVAVRSVHYHFENAESLYAEAVRRYEPRVARLVVAIDKRLPLETRIRVLVAQHDAVHRAIAPLYLAVRERPKALRSPSINEAMHRLRMVLDRHVIETLGDELRVVADSHGSRERITAAVSFETWRHLDRVQRLSRARLTRHMATSVLREFVD
jgi:AcrR family transcriptional regulator